MPEKEKKEKKPRKFKGKLMKDLTPTELIEFAKQWNKKNPIIRTFQPGQPFLE